VSARIGVIGAGFWAAYNYLPFYRDHPDVELVGVVRKNDEGLDAFRNHFGLEIATSSVDELLAAGLDGVVVSSPHVLHREHAIAALEAGAHVLVEKPMTVKVADAEAIRDAAQAAGRTVSVAHGWNYNRLAIWAKEMIDAGRIGRVTSVTGYKASCLTDLFSGVAGYGAVDVGGFPVEVEVETWARADEGGGYLYGQLSHLLGLGLLLAPGEPENVFARANLLDNGCDLDVQVSVQLDEGVIGSFSGHGRQPWVIRHGFDLKVAGEEGVLLLAMQRVHAELLLQGDKARGEVLHVGPEPPPRDEEGDYTCDGPAQFLVDTCLGREAVDRASAELGIRTVAVMEAAWESAHTGLPVSIDALRHAARA
jgi:predicted dehydrogenase